MTHFTQIAPDYVETTQNIVPKSAVENLLEDVRHAYTIYTTSGQSNADFAEFLSLSIEDFKAALQRPGLTARQLRRVVRRAGESYRSNGSQTLWSSYIAHYISDTANINLFD